MRTLINKFDKKELANLPIAAFEGKIVLVDSVGEADKAVDFLLKQPLIGIDTETRPSFQRGTFYQVALLQVSTLDICFLFRLNYIDVPDCLVRLLSDPSVTKVGLSLKDDAYMLRRRRAFTPGAFLDLQTFVRDFGIQDMSLQKIYANVFGHKISKSQQLTNWEADVLTEKQKKYAATDAWACVMLYNELNRIKEEGYELKIAEEPEPAPAEASNSLPRKEKNPREGDKNSSGGKKTSHRRKKSSSRKRKSKAGKAAAEANNNSENISQ